MWFDLVTLQRTGLSEYLQPSSWMQLVSWQRQVSWVQPLWFYVELEPWVQAPAHLTELQSSIKNK